MCHRIIMPDGSEIEGIKGEVCTCPFPIKEIYKEIIELLPGMECGRRLIIDHGVFDFEVKMERIPEEEL